MKNNRYIIHTKNTFWEEIKLETDESTLKKFLNNNDISPNDFYSNDEFKTITGANVIDNTENFLTPDRDTPTIEIYENDVKTTNLYWDNVNGFAKELSKNEYDKIETILEILDEHSEQLYELIDPYSSPDELMQDALFYNNNAIIGLSLEDNDEIIVHLVEIGDFAESKESTFNIKDMPKSIINDIYNLVCSFENIDVDNKDIFLFHYSVNSISEYFGSVVIVASSKNNADQILEKWLYKRYDNLLESDFDLEYLVNINNTDIKTLDNYSITNNIIFSNIILKNICD